MIMVTTYATVRASVTALQYIHHVITFNEKLLAI